MEVIDFPLILLDEISAFIWDSSRLEWEAARDCDLITAAEQFGRSGYGVGLQKNSFWTDQMNAAILSMHENGNMTELDKKWILEIGKDEAACSHRVDIAPTTLGLKNMAGVFVLLAAGIIGGVALIFIEILYKRRQTKQQRQLEVARYALDRWKKLVEVCTKISPSEQNNHHVFHSRDADYTMKDFASYGKNN